MEVRYESCCGLDVHKSSIAACILLEHKRKPEKHLRRFGCTTRDLLDLAEWFRSFGIQHVAMESTGVYWKPVWNLCSLKSAATLFGPLQMHEGVQLDRELSLSLPKECTSRIVRLLDGIVKNCRGRAFQA
jgi:hypothetical protein